MFDRTHTHTLALSTVTSCVSAKYMAKVWTIEQISSELKEYYNVEGLDDVRVIRDRQTSKASLMSPRSNVLLTELKQNNQDSSASYALQPCKRQKTLWTAITPLSIYTVIATSLTKMPRKCGLPTEESGKIQVGAMM